MIWFSRQPYTMPEHLLVSNFSVSRTFWQLIFTFLDLPFLLLPIAALFLPEIRKSRALSAVSLGYLFLFVHPSHLHGSFPLEPILGDWLNIHGIYGFTSLKGEPPIFLHRASQVLLTIASIGGTYCAA